MSKSKTFKVGKFLVDHPIIYYILLYSWGILYNLFGLLVFIFMIFTFHKPKIFLKNIYFVSRLSSGFGLELGFCFLVSKDVEENFIKNRDVLIHTHEIGHSYQNAIFGPLFPFLVAIPSVIRYWYRELKYYKKGLEPKTDYDSIWFEGSATEIGKYKYIKNKYIKFINKERG